MWAHENVRWSVIPLRKTYINAADGHPNVSTSGLPCMYVSWNLLA